MVDRADGENGSVASSEAEQFHDMPDHLISPQINSYHGDHGAESLIEQMNSLSRLGDSPRAFTEPADSSSGSANDASPVSGPISSSLLRLVNRPTAAAEQERRTRHFSDADRNGTPFDITRGDLVPLNDTTRSSVLPLPHSDYPSTVEKRGIGAASSALPLVPHECDAAECAVSRAIGTTELLEYILSWIETRDIRNFCRVSRAWNGTIKASPQLRLHLFALPQFRKPPADFELLPLSLPGLAIMLDEPLDRGRWIHVAMTRNAALRLSSGRGSAIRRPRARSIFEGLRGGLGSHRAGPSNDPWPAAASQKKAPDNIAIQHEDLYITQPPICAMQGFLYPRSSLLDSAHASEGVRDEEESSACAKLSCDTGITLGVFG